MIDAEEASLEGWYETADFTGAKVSGTTVTVGEGTKYYYAKAFGYATITYTTDYGTAPQSEKVVVDGVNCWTKPADLADAENIFGGWTTNGEDVVAAGFWTTPVTESVTADALWTAAAATANGIAYASIKAALQAPESAGQTVKFLQDATDSFVGSVSTAASTIDYNGRSVALIGANNTLTYTGTGTFTVTSSIKGGREVGNTTQVAGISVPAGVNLTISDMIFEAQISAKGGAGALLTVTGCEFLNTKNGAGTEEVQDGTKGNITYGSNCLVIGNGNFARMDIVGNTFNMRYRQCISAATTTIADAEIFVYGNEFIGTKDCRKTASEVTGGSYWPAGLQIYSGQFYIENNTFTGPYAQGIFSISPQATGSTCNIICRGNTLKNGVKYLWVNHDGSSLANNTILFADNDWTEADPDFTTTEGIYGGGTESNAEKPYKEGVALPTGCESFYAWLHGDNAEKPYYINDAYAEDLTGLKAGDVLTAQPLEDVVVPSTLALSAIDAFENKFNVVDKPTAVAVKVTIGEGVASVTYGGQTYTETFTISDVAPEASLVFTETLAGDQYIKNTTCTGDISTEDGLTFTVAADLTSPNAEITFSTLVAAAVIYSTADDSFIGTCDTFSNAQEEAAVDGQYVKFFRSYFGSDWTEQIHFNKDGVMRMDLNGNTVVGCVPDAGKLPGCGKVAAMVKGDKYTTYTSYADLATAFAAEGSAVEYALVANTAASNVTLTAQNLSLKGVFWRGYNGMFAFTDNDGPKCDGCAPTATWGATETTFEFVAEATSTDPREANPQTPAEVETALGNLGVSDLAKANITTVEEFAKFDGYFKTKTQSQTWDQVTDVQKANAYLCYALNADAIPNAEITDDDVTIDSFANGVIEIAIEGVEAGDEVPAAMIAKVIDVIGNNALTDMTADKVQASGQATANGKVQVTVAPAEKITDTSKFFYRASVKK